MVEISVQLMPSGDRATSARLFACTAINAVPVQVIPCHSRLESALAVQVTPVGDVMEELGPPKLPTPTNNDPFQAIPDLLLLFGVVRAIQVIPSAEVAAIVPLASAAKVDPFHEVARQLPRASDARSVHVIPSGDVAAEMEALAVPTAAKTLPFHATAPQFCAEIVLAVHVIPSGEVAARVTGPDPTATKIEPFQAIARHVPPRIVPALHVI